MDIYLIGTPVRQLLSEVSCGDTHINGVKVEVPLGRYDGIIERIKKFLAENRENRDVVNRFLGYRCGKSFLELFLAKIPTFFESLSVGTYFYAVSSISVINKMHSFGLLPENQRIRHVASVRDLAVNTPDAGFLNSKIISFLNPDEIKEILSEFRENLLPHLNDQVDNWRDNYSNDENAYDYFQPLKDALSEFATALASDPEAAMMIEEGMNWIDEVITGLDSRNPSEPDYEDYHEHGSTGPSGADSRSIFDDVDE